jgi:hypothetical protein
MKWRRFTGVLVASALLAGGLTAPIQAQEVKTCVPTRTLINQIGNGADMAVAGTATQILNESAVSCQRMLRNNGTAPMRCMPVAQGVPTTTVGLLLNSGDQLLMGTEGRQSWQCIRTTASSTTATTIEGLP